MMAPSSWMSCWSMVGVVVLFSACGGDGPDAGAATLPDPGRQFIVGVDISGSRSDTQLKESQQLLNKLVMRMRNGDKLVLVETYQSGTDAAQQWADTIPRPRNAAKPSARDRNKLASFQRRASPIASSFFDPARAKQIKNTDLLGTLARAADYARAANGRRTTVLLLSDMLQTTPEVNMVHPGGIPGADWIATRKADGRLPDLSNVCVVIAGADVTSDQGARVRAFWQKYFAATNATLPAAGYRNMISDPAELRCP
jgi:hypothetical protein